MSMATAKHSMPRNTRLSADEVRARVCAPETDVAPPLPASLAGECCWCAPAIIVFDPFIIITDDGVLSYADTKEDDSELVCLPLTQMLVPPKMVEGPLFPVASFTVWSCKPSQRSLKLKAGGDAGPIQDTRHKPRIRPSQDQAKTKTKPTTQSTPTNHRERERERWIRAMKVVKIRMMTP